MITYSKEYSEWATRQSHVTSCQIRNIHYLLDMLAKLKEDKDISTNT